MLAGQAAILTLTVSYAINSKDNALIQHTWIILLPMLSTVLLISKNILSVYILNTYILIVVHYASSIYSTKTSQVDTPM